MLAGDPLRSTSATTLVDIRSGLRFAKSPQWAGRELLLLDIHDRCVKSVDLLGEVRIVERLSFVPGGFAVLPGGALVVADARRRLLYRCDSTGAKQIADVSDIARFSINDGVVDSLGGMYFGDVGFDFMNPLTDPVPDGVIVYIDVDGRSTVVARNLFFPNGMLITADKSTLIVAEAMGHCLTAFDIGKGGSLRNRRVWAQFQNDVSPDGICLDCEGSIWVAATGPRALHVREGGEIDRQITTTRPVFATLLGGSDGKRLFMCTSDSNDPVITRRRPCASVDIAEVTVPAART